MKDIDPNNKTYKEYVLETINELCPNKKMTTYTNEYYYDMMLLVLKDITSWRSLRITKYYIDKKENHYTTIRKKFNKWNKLDVFRKAYEKLINNVIVKWENKKEIDLFIDSTFINNKTGSELVGVNPMNYKKRVTKLSIICDNNKQIIKIIPIKTTKNDCVSIEDTIENLKKHKKINLIGDKGYIARHEIKDRLRIRKIRLITPRKRNQKKKRLSISDRIKLKKRNKVENCIKDIKSYSRIATRTDKLIINYMGFVYIACALNIKKDKIV